MKKKCLPYLALCLAFLLLALSGGSGARAEDRGSLTPLPDDVRIEPPGPGITPAIGSLSGIWQGELEVC